MDSGTISPSPALSMSAMYLHNMLMRDAHNIYNMYNQAKFAYSNNTDFIYKKGIYSGTSW